MKFYDIIMRFFFIFTTPLKLEKTFVYDITPVHSHEKTKTLKKEMKMTRVTDYTFSLFTID